MLAQKLACYLQQPGQMVIVIVHRDRWVAQKRSQWLAQLPDRIPKHQRQASRKRFRLPVLKMRRMLM